MCEAFIITGFADDMSRISERIEGAVHEFMERFGFEPTSLSVGNQIHATLIQGWGPNSVDPEITQHYQGMKLSLHTVHPKMFNLSGVKE